MVMAAGPKMTTRSEGRMKRIKGNTSFTGNLAATSSAFWNLLVLMESEWILKDWAMLVPNLSV